MNKGPERMTVEASSIVDQCAALELRVKVVTSSSRAIELLGPADEIINIRLDNSAHSMIEQVLQQLVFDFDKLPLLTRGESKEIRLLTPAIALAKLIPTVYSFTHQRYGIAEGTDHVRALFCVQLFRQMARNPSQRHLANAFLGAIETASGLLIAEHVVAPGNIEVRVKRYHIGSPVHRYRLTSDYATAGGGPPLQRWQRFERPIVCFDWRHPLTDEGGLALADEPLPDDYAAIWLDDVAAAKRLVLDTFEWIEEMFAAKGLKLIDICFFVDATGQVVFGEISPDCMRVRSSASDNGDALDKDEWRSGGEPAAVLERYKRLYTIVFGTDVERLAA